MMLLPFHCLCNRTEYKANRLITVIDKPMHLLSNIPNTDFTTASNVTKADIYIGILKAHGFC